ncbi:MAG: radical SAM protein [Rhizobiales bacterium 65-9]|nr:PA0069 family radical SAM protein [Hyphomicrobiales bacterium]OJY34800.1 MAG: radical SAM protein [Rhizobiales bacterium 65-9]
MPARRAAVVVKGPREPDPDRIVDGERRRGRGAASNESGRFESELRETVDDGWDSLAELPALKTEVAVEKARTIITRNDSPDISFDRSINPYRGCEHGCIYCFARPTHAYMGLSPGLDFETRLFMKPDAAALLERELGAANYKPQTIAIGTNTDPYQPIERTHRITRQVLEVLARTNHPVGIVTKSALVTRDIDLLAPMAAKGLAKVAISLTSLDPRLARAMEPRAATPPKRLETMRKLSEAGIPVGVLTAPLIPAINDAEVEKLLEAARGAGATEAGYVLLRLPLELADLFREWLLEHYPDKMRHVMSLVRQTRDGKDYVSEWGVRQSGSGPYAWMMGRRFELAAQKLGFGKRRLKLRTDLFTPPGGRGRQMELF